jgi:hypothetical protein
MYFAHDPSDPTKKQFGCYSTGPTTEQQLRKQWGDTCTILKMFDYLFVCIVRDFQGDEIPNEDGEPSGDKFVMVPKDVCWALRTEHKINMRKQDVPRKVRNGREKTYHLSQNLYNHLENICQELDPKFWRMLDVAIPKNAMKKELQKTWDIMDSFMKTFLESQNGVVLSKVGLQRQMTNAVNALARASASNYETDDETADEGDSVAPVVAPAAAPAAIPVTPPVVKMEVPDAAAAAVPVVAPVVVKKEAPVTTPVVAPVVVKKKAPVAAPVGGAGDLTAAQKAESLQAIANALESAFKKAKTEADEAKKIAEQQAAAAAAANVAAANAAADYVDLTDD